jgi:hypothetical protein
MAVLLTRNPRITRVVVHPATDAGARYRAGRQTDARAAGFPSRTGLNLHFFGGRTIEHLTFTNIYLGGKAKWSADDVHRIDHGLSAAMQDQHLNNVLAQYYADGNATSAFKPSRILQGTLPARVYRDTIEHQLAALHQQNALSGFDFHSSVFCFMLPRGTVLVDGTSTGHQQRRDDDDDNGANLAARERDEAADSKHGLGGYHGSIHSRRGNRTEIVYYAVGVYSEGNNGIVAFDEPWKNVCATFYHELCEARTDPDVEDAIRAGDASNANDFLGWYSARGGEIGDIPLDEAGANIGAVMKEVPLTNGAGTVPVQLMWSNAVGGPEGPIAHKH